MSPLDPFLPLHPAAAIWRPANRPARSADLTMTRIFLDEPMTVGDAVALRGDTARYLLDVLRLQPGERFVIVDAGGRAFEVAVEACLPGRVEVTVSAPLEGPGEPGVRLTLFQALLKGKSFELVVQKSTELGVAAIVPVVTARTIARPDAQRLEGRLERWGRIALEACRQCGRTEVPEVCEPVTLDGALEQMMAAGTPALLPYEAMAGDGDTRLRQVLRSLAPAPALSALVGPEGGFAPQEVDAARVAGLRVVSLGSLILRAETAALALVANVMYELG